MKKQVQAQRPATNLYAEVTDRGSSRSWRRGGCHGPSPGAMRARMWACRAMPGPGGATRASMC